MIIFAERLTLIIKTGPLKTSLPGCWLLFSATWEQSGREAVRPLTIGENPNRTWGNYEDQAGAYISGTPVEEKNSICHLWGGPFLLPLHFRDGYWNFYIPHKYFPAPSSVSPYLITGHLYLHIMLNITFISSQPSFLSFPTSPDLERD